MADDFDDFNDEEKEESTKGTAHTSDGKARPNDQAYNVAADELRQFIEQFEQLEAEKKDITGQQKEVMAEAKARGYDTKVMRKVIAIRKRDRDSVAEENAILAIYGAALGMDDDLL